MHSWHLHQAGHLAGQHRLVVWSLSRHCFHTTQPGRLAAISLTMGVVSSMLFCGSVLAHEVADDPAGRSASSRSGRLAGANRRVPALPNLILGFPLDGTVNETAALLNPAVEGLQ